MMKLNLKGEGGGGAFQSNSERCHQHESFTLALVVLTLTEYILPNMFNSEYLNQH